MAFRAGLHNRTMFVPLPAFVFTCSRAGSTKNTRHGGTVCVCVGGGFRGSEVVTLVVERVVSEVEGVNHGGGVLRQRRRHLLREVPGDDTAEMQLFGAGLDSPSYQD